LLLAARRAIESDPEIGDDAAMKRALPSIIFAAACSTGAALPAIAAGSDTGRDIAANCASCHHGDRRAGAAIPGLAGMDKAVMIARMREFRDGARPSTIMRQLANGYTNAQIEAAAAYLSTQKP